MMKKTILIVLVLALLAPAAAFAATEFSLGGFIKLDTIWDSTQNPKTALTPIARNNDQQYHHGHFLMTAQGTRFNFTIKGPKLWGATTTGFIEMDFDGSADARVSATSSYAPRLRHAMFRLNWPETELMFGQYWGMFSEFAPENPGDADFANHGWSLNRVPQIRLTQKFAGNWTVAAAICKPYDPSTADVNFSNPVVSGGQFQYQPGGNLWPGQSSETPQLQAKLSYEGDLWGKAPYYGRPRGFVAQLTGGWQRTRYQSGTYPAATGVTWGQNLYAGGLVAGTSGQTTQQYLDPWCLQGTLFIPVIPTHSANLAGTASLSAQWYIGRGCSFVGYTQDADNSWLDFRGVTGNGLFSYDRQLMNQFGGYLQGQYWFTNQWFVNVVWGMQRQYGIDTSISGLLAGKTATNPVGYKYASNSDQMKLWNEIDIALFYRPIESMKFGLQYAYERCDYMQKLNNPSSTAIGAQGQASSGGTNLGEAHRVEFGAWLFF